MDWFLYDRDLRHERDKRFRISGVILNGCPETFCKIHRKHLYQLVLFLA